MDKILVLGIGNYSRADDGLGWRFIDELKDFINVYTDYRYQLQIEDTALISQYDIVIFADAAVDELKNGFSFAPCLPRNEFHFSTHRIDPSALLWLCENLYHARPQVYVMKMQGFNWGLDQPMSEAAENNFLNAMKFFKIWLEGVNENSGVTQY